MVVRADGFPMFVAGIVHILCDWSERHFLYCSLFVLLCNLKICS